MRAILWILVISASIGGAMCRRHTASQESGRYGLLLDKSCHGPGRFLKEHSRKTDLPGSLERLSQPQDHLLKIRHHQFIQLGGLELRGGATTSFDMRVRKWLEGVDKWLEEKVPELYFAGTFYGSILGTVYLLFVHMNEVRHGSTELTIIDVLVGLTEVNLFFGNVWAHAGMRTLAMKKMPVTMHPVLYSMMVEQFTLLSSFHTLLSCVGLFAITVYREQWGLKRYVLRVGIVSFLCFAYLCFFYICSTEMLSIKLSLKGDRQVSKRSTEKRKTAFLQFCRWR